MKPNDSCIRVAVVEDRPEDRDRFVRLLSESAGLRCVAACRSATEALTILPGQAPDIVLMDIGLPGTSGIDCLRELAPLLPRAQFMMLTVFEDHDLIFQSLAAGATGYLLKKTPAPKLLEAVRELHEGGAPMSGQIARQVVGAFRQSRPSANSILSASEQSVLGLLARGLMYKEVAERLNLSIYTVRTHIWHIYRKLHVHNRTEAILKGLQGPPR